MKRLILTVGIIALLIAGIVTSLPLFVSSATVRGYIVDHLTSLSGREVSFRGNPRVSFKPFLGIEISDMIISDPAALENESPLLHVDRIQAQLDILPALIGQIKITQYRLVRPILNLKVYGDGNSNWHFQTGQLREAFDETRSLGQNEDSKVPVSASLGTFTIVDGVVRYEDTIADKEEKVTSIDGTIQWQSTNEAASIDLTAVWQGENISTKASAVEPMKLIAGGQSSTQWTFESAPATLEFSGEANTLSNLFLKGNVNLQTPSVRRLSEFFTSYLGEIKFPGGLEINGNIEATSEAIRITDSEMNIAGHSATGVLSLSRDEVESPSLDGTLAFDTVDLTEFLLEEIENTQDDTAPTEGLGIKVDLRLSANMVDVGPVEFKQVAAAVNINEDTWTFDIGDSQIFGGNMVARLGKREEQNNSPVILEISANNIDTALIFSLMEDRYVGLSGTADFNGNLRGNTLNDFLTIRGPNGTFSGKIGEGSIIGIDIPFILDQTTGSDSPDLIGSNLGQSTYFQSSEFKFFINNGIASLSQSKLFNADSAIQMNGRVDLRYGNLALRAQEVTENGLQPERLFIGGTLKAPLVSLKKSELKKTQAGDDADAEGIST